MKNAIKKRFVVRKYIMATSAKQAIAIERKYTVDDCFIDAEWSAKNENYHSREIKGFSR